MVEVTLNPTPAGKDAHVLCFSTTYSDARTGAGTLQADDSLATSCGQTIIGSSYYCQETFYLFDTSVIPAGSMITSAVFSLYCYTAFPVIPETDFVVEVYKSSWTSPIATTDFVSGAALSSDDVITSFNTTGLTLDAYNDFPSGTAITNSIVCGGETGFMVTSANHRTGTPPTDDERIAIQMATYTNPPKLTIQYVPGKSFLWNNF